MMKSKVMKLGALVAIVGLSACSSMNSTYKIKSEKGKRGTWQISMNQKLVIPHG